MQVWSHSQGVFPLQRDLVRVLKLPADAVVVSHAQNAGCYGHNGADDAALDAALLARAVPGRPVQLQWMRDDEFQWEPYNPAMEMALSAGLSAEGRIVEWTHEVWSNHHNNRPLNPKEGSNLLASWHLAEPHPPVYPRALPQPAGSGDRNAVPLYDFPNQKVVFHLIPEAPLRTSALRTLGAYGNVFAVESFMDELAAAAGVDPAEFRLRHLKDARARAVIEAAVKLAAEDTGRPAARIGFARYKNLVGLCLLRRRGGAGSRDRCGAGAAGLVGGGCRPGHHPRRAAQPDRGRHHPGRQLDGEGGPALRPAAASWRRTGAPTRSSASPRCRSCGRCC